MNKLCGKHTVYKQCAHSFQNIKLVCKRLPMCAWPVYHIARNVGSGKQWRIQQIELRFTKILPANVFESINLIPHDPVDHQLVRGSVRMWLWVVFSNS